MNTINIEDLTKRLLPLTYLRRNAGEVLANLPKVGTYILTKDGKPVAKLSVLEKEAKKEDIDSKLKKLRKLAGGFKLGGDLTPEKINKIIDKSYEHLLPRQ